MSDDTIEALCREIEMLREANAAAVAQEQINRNEANRLRGVVAQLTEERDVALVTIGELREALAHYKNNPPPHPAHADPA